MESHTPTIGVVLFTIHPIHPNRASAVVSIDGGREKKLCAKGGKVEYYTTLK